MARILVLLLIVICGLQICIVRRGTVPAEPASPAPKTSAISAATVPSSAASTHALRGLSLLLQSLRSDTRSLLDEAEREFEQTDPRARGLDLAHHYLHRRLHIPDLETLSPMREAAYRYVYERESGPSVYVRFLLDFYTHDGVGDASPAVRQLSLDFFTEERGRRIFRMVHSLYPSLEGKKVVSVGCGLGPALKFFVHAVGPKGRVTGEDIEAGCLAFIRWAAAHGVPEMRRVKTVLGRPNDICLQPSSVDVILVSDVHAAGLTDMSFSVPSERLPRVEWIQSMHRALRPNGLVVVYESAAGMGLGCSETVRLMSLGGLRERRRQVLQGGGFIIELGREDDHSGRS